MTILASRENTCIHPQVAAYSNKNEACVEMLDVSIAVEMIIKVFLGGKIHLLTFFLIYLLSCMPATAACLLPNFLMYS